MLLLFASILAMAASFSASAQRVMVQYLYETVGGNTKQYTSPSNVTVSNVQQIDLGVLFGLFSTPSGYSDNLASYVEIKSEKGNVATPSSVMGAGMNLIIKFDPEFTTPGTYTLTLKEGAAYFTDNGTTSYSPKFEQKNLFTIEGTEPDPGEDPGEDPGDDPVTENEWWKDFVVELEGYPYDASDLRISFPNLPAGVKLVEACEEYTLYSHIYYMANGKKITPYMAMINTYNELIGYFDEDYVADLKEGEFTLYVDADAVAADGVNNPELVWPEGGAGDEPNPPTPPAAEVNSQLAWVFGSVHDAELGKWIYSYETEELKEIKKADKVQVKIEKPSTMEFEEWKELALSYIINYGKSGDVKVSNGTDNYVPSALDNKGYIVVELSFTDAISADGTYSITLPEGLVTFGGGSISAAADLADVFTINANAKVLSFSNYTIIPADKAVVNNADLSTVAVTFPDAVDLMDEDMEIVMSDIYTASSIKLTTAGTEADPETGDVEDVTVATAQSVDIIVNRVNINFGTLNLPAGKYTLTVPAGMFVNSAKTNVVSEAIVVDYEIAETIVYTLNDYTLTPESGKEVEELSEITLEFLYDIEPCTEDLSGVTLKNGSTVYTCQNAGFVEGKDNAVYFSFDSITENGTYTLTIPANLFTIVSTIAVDVFNPEITATYVVGNENSVSAIFAGETSFTVVDAAGRVVMRDADSLNGLQPGLYIINGKKVFLRK